MTPSNVKKLIMSIVTQLKVDKKWNVEDVSVFKKDTQDGRALSVSFMHKSFDEKTKNNYFTLHTNYMGVWFGTFKISLNGSVSIRSLNLVISPSKVKELTSIEKLEWKNNEVNPVDAYPL
jgi:hypothetical protein